MAKRRKFETVYKEFNLPLTKFVIKRIGDKSAAEEVIESTMVAAWKGFNTFKHKSSYFTWLCRIALNKIADYYRDQVNARSKLVVPLIEAIAHADTKTLSPEETLALKELKRSVNECLDLLPPEKRRLLQFRYWQDLSYNEIAKILGTSERSVEGQLYRARHEFAKTWNGKDYDR